MIPSTVSEATLYDYAERRKAKPTKYEAMLWKRLKYGYMQVNFEREIIIAGFAVDFYCHDARIAIELDGPYHEFSVRKDRERDQQIFNNGVKVMRFKNPRTYYEVTRILFRVWPECRYQIRRRKIFFPTDAQLLQHQQGPTTYLQKKEVNLGSVVCVQNVENTRTAMAHKAAVSEGQLCAECGNARWMHYNELRHSFKKPGAV